MKDCLAAYNDKDCMMTMVDFKLLRGIYCSDPAQSSDEEEQGGLS